MHPFPGNNRNSNVRRLEPQDVLRCFVIGAGEMSSLALPLLEMGRSQSFRLPILRLSRRHLWPRSEDSVWVWTEGRRPLGIASVRPRSGDKSWELSHLFADANHETSIQDLLEAATRASASQGAERVFLRLSAESDTVPVARRAGFFPGFRETLYSGRPDPTQIGHGLFDVDSRLRTRLDKDDHDLFRIYNAATPVRVRQLVGMTLDQWRASRERRPGRRWERVFEIDGSVLRTAGDLSQHSGTGILALVGSPRLHCTDSRRCGRRTPKSLSRASTILVMVPRNTPPLWPDALEARGLRAVGEFATLVNSTAQMVRERVAVPVILGRRRVKLHGEPLEQHHLYW